MHQARLISPIVWPWSWPAPKDIFPLPRLTKPLRSYPMPLVHRSSFFARAEQPRAWACQPSCCYFHLYRRTPIQKGKPKGLPFVFQKKELSRPCCYGSCCRFGQDAMVDGEQRQFQAVRDADLVIHVAQVILDDLLGGAELGGDFFVLVSLHNQGNDLQFLGGDA